MKAETPKPRSPMMQRHYPAKSLPAPAPVIKEVPLVALKTPLRWYEVDERPAEHNVSSRWWTAQLIEGSHLSVNVLWYRSVGTFKPYAQTAPYEWARAYGPSKDSLEAAKRVAESLAMAQLVRVLRELLPQSEIEKLFSLIAQISEG